MCAQAKSLSSTSHRVLLVYLLIDKTFILFLSTLTFPPAIPTHLPAQHWLYKGIYIRYTTIIRYTTYVTLASETMY